MKSERYFLVILVVAVYLQVVINVNDDIRTKNTPTEPERTLASSSVFKFNESKQGQCKKIEDTLDVIELGSADKSRNLFKSKRIVRRVPKEVWGPCE